MSEKFYLMKKEAQTLIDTYIQDNKHTTIHTHTIKLLIARRFGFGERFVNNYLDLLEQGEFIKIEKGIINVQ